MGIADSYDMYWFPFLTAEIIDPVLIKHKESIESFGYLTRRLKSVPG